MSIRRVVAYDPLTGDFMGELPDAENLTTVRDLYGLPTGRIVYPWSGINGSFLEDPVEIGIERTGRGGGSTNFTEYPNSRYLLQGEPDNDNYTEGVSRTYNLIGIGVKLQWAAVYTPSPSDEPDGTPVRQMRHWTNKNVGAILGDIWTEQQALGFLDGLTKDWGFAADSTGATWTTAETLDYFEVPIEMTFWDLVQTFVEQGIIECWFNEREFRIFIARTQLYRDLTIGGAPTGFYWGPQSGITKQTEAVDYINTTTDALVIGADGRLFTPHNFGSDGGAYYGPALRTANVPWAYTADEAHAAVDSMFRAGANPRREITVEIDWDSGVIEPDLDFRVGDRVIVQKGDYPQNPDSAANFGEQRVLTITETDDKDGRSGTITFGSKLARLEILTAQRAARLAAGSATSTAGLSRPPGPEQREPSAPTSFGITPANEPDEQGRQRANHALTWAWSGDAVPDPVTGQVDPIEIKGFEIEYQSDYTDNDWQLYTRAKSTATAARLRNLPADTDYLFRIRAIPYTGITPSDWATSTTVTIPADLDALPGPDEIQDSGHRNAGVRAKRKSDAGTGFDWVSDTSEYVASFTSTTPTLDYGVGAKLKSYRRQCRPGDIIVVDGEIKRVGGTAANVRIAVRFFDASGATLSTVNAISSFLATTSWASVTAGTATAPAGARTFTVRVNQQVRTGSAELRVRNVTAFRQTDTDRVKDAAIVEVKHADNSVSTRTVVNDAITEPKHGPLSASTRVLDNLAVTNGKTSDDAQDPRTIGADAIETVHLSTGLDVDGTITTGSGLTVGGLDASDIDFPGTATIGDTGTGIFVTASNAAFSDSGTYVGTWTDVSTLDSKVSIRKVTREQCEALLSLAPVMYKRRQAWSRQYGKRVIRDKHLPEGWEKDPKRPGKKRWRKAKTIKGREIPGEVDTRPHVGLIAEEVRATGKLDVLLARHERNGLDVLSVDYTKIPMFMLPILAELLDRVSDLEAQLNDQTKG